MVPHTRARARTQTSYATVTVCMLSGHSLKSLHCQENFIALSPCKAFWAFSVLSYALALK